MPTLTLSSGGLPIKMLAWLWVEDLGVWIKQTETVISL